MSFEPRNHGARTLAATLAFIAVIPTATDVIPRLPVVVRVGAASAGGVPADFILEFSSGGGFTGMSRGVRITADGSVIRWRSGPTGTITDERRLGILERSTLESLVGLVKSTGFLNLVLDEPGNVTVTVAATIDGRRHIVRYPEGAGQRPAAIRPLVEAVEAAVKQAETGGGPS